MFENVFNAMSGRQKVKYNQIFICGMIDNNLPCFVKFSLANISVSTNAKIKSTLSFHMIVGDRYDR